MQLHAQGRENNTAVLLAPFMDCKLAETSGLTLERTGFTDCIQGLLSHQHFQSFSVRMTVLILWSFISNWS